MNYVPIHTNLYPNYNYLSAENAYLKQTLEYKDAVLCEQAETITKLQTDVQQASQASNTFKAERDKFEADARRWAIMQQIIRQQGCDQHLYQVQKVVDKEMARNA